MAVTLDRARFDRVMASTCHALVFDQTGEKLSTDVEIFSPSIVHKNLERDEREATLAFTIRRALKDKPQLGENPEVFWCQFIHEDQLTAFRLQFYGGFPVYGIADARPSQVT
jgi:hypothetical protein